MLDFNIMKDFAADDTRVCAVSDEKTLYYKELYSYVTAMAAHLYAVLPSDHAPIMLIGDKENLFLAGLFAVLYTGHPYVAVSSTFPTQRILEIAESCHPSALFNFSSVKYEKTVTNWYEADELFSIASAQAPVCKPYDWKDNDLFALFYTSGSTGNPKGVKITYGNMACNVRKRVFLSREFLNYGENEQPVLLNFSSYGFIASTTMIFYDIANLGVKLYAIDRSMLSDYKKLIKYICKVNPSQFTCTPSFLDICLKNASFCQENLPRLQAVFSGGGEVNMSLIKRFKDRFKAKIINVYGLTEATSMVLYSSSSFFEKSESGIMPSGYPLPETEVVITNENNQACADGEIGELRIISPSISIGYVNSDNSRFFTTADGRHGFCTGDLFEHKNGYYYYRGRKDSMVKIGGYRVELFDVERNLIALDEVRDAIVVPCCKDGEVKLLTAYIILENGFEPKLKTTLIIKKKLAQRIQPYALPQAFRYIESIPLNVNNKPDRILLRHMATKAAFG